MGWVCRLLVAGALVLWAAWDIGAFPIQPRSTTKSGFPAPSGAALTAEEYDEALFGLASLGVARSSTQTLSTGSQIDCRSNAMVPVVSSSGAVTLTSNPQILTPTDLPATKLCLIEGTSDTNTVTLVDGNGLDLGGSPITLVDNMLVLLAFNGSQWLLVSGGGAGGGGVTDGDKGDVVVSGSGATWTVDANSVALTTETTGNYVAGVTANQGLLLTGTEGATLGLLTCTTGQILKNVAGTSWACAADDTGAGGSDSTAIHDDQAGEIAAVADKATPVAGDHLLIEDSAAANGKKDITIGSIPLSILSGAVTDGQVPNTITIDTAATAGQVRIALPNEAATGTVLNRVVKLAGAPSTATRADLSDTSGAMGICISSCTTTGNATLVTQGIVQCDFDDATVAGNYVVMSGNAAGKCQDAGATFPASGQVLGRVTQTIGAAGLADIVLWGNGVQDTTASTPGLPAVLAVDDDYTGATSLATCVYIGNATNGICLYTDGTNVPQIRAVDAARTTSFTLDHKSFPTSDWRWWNENDTACTTIDSVTGAMTSISTGTCSPSINTPNTITAGRFNLEGTTCLEVSADRIFHDTDCDGTKDAGEEFIDQAGGGGSVSDTVYGAGWNADTTTAPSKNAVYDQVELKANLASPTFTGTVTLPSGTTLVSPVLTAPSVTVGVPIINTTPVTLTAADCGKFLNISTGAGTINLMADPSGCLICLFQTNAVAVVLEPNASDGWLVDSYNTENGTALALASGDSLTLAAGAGNSLCFLGISATQIRLLAGTLGSVSDSN